MKPIDVRNAKFEELQPLLTGLRRRVWEGWIAYPGLTTRELAAVTGIDLLTLRPRTTELYQMGVVTLIAVSPGDNYEGTYAARTMEEWQRWHELQQTNQLQLI